MKVGELHQDEAKVILDGLRDVDTGKADIAAARQRIAAEIAALDDQHARQRLGRDRAVSEEIPSGDGDNPRESAPYLSDLRQNRIN